MKGFDIVPVDAVPARVGRSASSVYGEIVQSFGASGLEAAQVRADGRKAQALALGLRKAVAALEVPYKVQRRGDDVFITR